MKLCHPKANSVELVSAQLCHSPLTPRVTSLIIVRRVNVEAEGGCEAVVYSEDFLKLNQAKVAFCDMSS